MIRDEGPAPYSSSFSIAELNWLYWRSGAVCRVRRRRDTGFVGFEFVSEDFGHSVGDVFDRLSSV